MSAEIRSLQFTALDICEWLCAETWKRGEGDSTQHYWDVYEEEHEIE
jgi:hypothetical protein